MGSRRGPEQTIGQQNFKMKFLLVLCLLGLVAGSEDYKMFMKWAKTKAMESCWGEDNMKVYTVNMKKAVAKCQQKDVPELDLPPLRAINRMANNMVNMAGHKEDQHHEMEYFARFFRFMQMMMMKEMMNNKNIDSTGSWSKFDNNERRNEEPSMYNFVKKMGYQNKNEDYMKSGSGLESMFRSMGQMRYKRQAGDSLALNDRLKEKLEHMMEEHVEEISNMTCVLRELNVIDQNNNIDISAMKKDAEQYKMPSAWFGGRYEEILESCHQVAENLPASLQDKVLPNTYNGPMRNLAKIKSFMSCCKTAKMKLCMYQDTKKKIETNFGPVDQLLEGFNNQITEEQVFYMVNELLQGDDDEFM